MALPAKTEGSLSGNPDKANRALPPNRKSKLWPAESGIVSRVTRGVGALSLGVLVTLLSQVTVPIALYVWGKFRFGEWILLSGLVQLLKLSDMGMQTFVVNRLCASFVGGNRDEFHRVLNSSLRVQIIVALIVLVCIAVAAALLPVGSILGLRTIQGRALFAVIVLLSAELLLGIPMGTIAGVYRATGHLARAAIIGATQEFALLAATTLLIAANAGFPLVASGQFTIAILISAIILGDLHCLHPWLRLRDSLGSWREGLKMVGPGLFFLLIPLADYVSTQFTLMVTQKSLGGGEVSRLATHRMIVNFGMMLSSLLTNAMWPELTRLYVKGKTQLLMRAHNTMMKLNLWLVGGSLLLSLPIVSLVYPVWTSRTLTLDGWTLGFLMGRFLLWTTWSASSTVLWSINRHYFACVAVVAEALLTGTASYFLVPRLGIRGAAFAALLADLAVCAWLMPLLLTREFRAPISSVARNTLRASLPIVLTIGLWFAVRYFSSSRVIDYVVALPACAGLGLVLMFHELEDGERAILHRCWMQVRQKAPGGREVEEATCPIPV